MLNALADRRGQERKNGVLKGIIYDSDGKELSTAQVAMQDARMQMIYAQREKEKTERKEGQYVKKCNDCCRLSFVKGYTEASQVYQGGCQREGCKNRADNELLRRSEVCKKYRVEEHFATIRNEGLRDSKSRLVCINYESGKGREKGNECPLRHGRKWI